MIPRLKPPESSFEQHSMGWVLRTEDVSGFSPSPRNGRGSTPGRDGLTVEQPVDPGGLDRLWKSLRWQEVEDGNCLGKRDDLNLEDYGLFIQFEVPW